MTQENCIFCHIIQGEIPCVKIFESDELISFLDIHPVNPGHALVVPKKHVATLFEMPDTLGCTVFQTLRRVGEAVMLGVGAQGLNVVQNNFAAAGQEVPHVHWHLIPRFDGDGHGLWVQGDYADMQQMTALAKNIRARL